MNLITKLILKEWFRSFISSFGVMLLLIIVADSINALLQGYPKERIYYDFIIKMPNLLSKIIPITAMMASLFSLNNLKAHSELISILASSFSIKNFYIIIFLCSLVPTSLQFLLNGYISPKMKEIRFKNYKANHNTSNLVARSSLSGENLFWYKSNEYFTSFLFYDSINRKILKPTFYYINEGVLSLKIEAESAILKKENLWELKSATTFKDLNKNAFPTLTKMENKTLTLNESHEDFSQFSEDLETLSFFEYKNFLSIISKTGVNITSHLVNLHDKISISVLCILFSWIPLISLSQPNKRNSSFGKTIVFTVIIALTYWFLYSNLINYSKSGQISLYIGVYILPFLLLLFNLFSFRRLNKL